MSQRAWARKSGRMAAAGPCRFEPGWFEPAGLSRPFQLDGLNRLAHMTSSGPWGPDFAESHPRRRPMQWMIYGANGYTGRLIAAEAVRRGLAPVLAGRNEAALREMGQALGLRWRQFGLEHESGVREGLRDIGLVLHCAGPFSATSAPMLEGCLATGTHYLDI